MVAVACSKDPAERRPWDGPTKLIHHEAIEAVPASKTDFEAVRLRGHAFDLTVPVNWKQGVPSNRSVRDRLHQWRWIWPLLKAYDTTKDKKSLQKALEIVFDWIEQNPIGASDSQTQAWRQGNAAWRAEALGYLFRAGVEAGLLNEDQEETLLKSSREHAVWLLSDEHYGKGDRDGQAQDYALLVLCTQLNKIADCKAWKDIAVKRFIKNVRRSVSQRANLYLSQSPRYHFAAVERVSHMAALAKDPELSRLEDELKKAAAWLVPPDGNMLMLGYTRAEQAPAWARDGAKGLSGMAPLDDSGLAIVRKEGSYLVASAAYHTRTKKQSDELTFSWSEFGHRIISDTGYYKFSERPAKSRFADSSRAHNTLIADGQDFHPTKPYGSAIKAMGEQSGWYAIMANNPSIATSQVAHERVWLYQPGEWLVVVDRVGSPRKHSYQRFFHFWHDLEAKLSEDGVAKLEVQKTPLYFRDFSEPEVDTKLVSKQKKPLQGIMFPKGKKPVPNQVLELKSEGDRALYAAAFRVGKEFPEKMSASYDPETGYRIALGDQVFTLSRKEREVLFNAPSDKKADDDKKKADQQKTASDKKEAAKTDAKKLTAPAPPKPATPAPAPSAK